MRLIDADKLIEHITNTADLGGWIGEALQQIKQVAIKYINLAPSIDICFCKECISADEKPIADGRYWCNSHGCYMRFCSDGEREGE